MILLALMIYGYVIGRFQVFPYDYLEILMQDHLEFARRDALEQEATVLEKLKNDLSFSFARFLYRYHESAAFDAVLLENASLKGLREAPLYI